MTSSPSRIRGPFLSLALVATGLLAFVLASHPALSLFGAVLLTIGFLRLAGSASTARTDGSFGLTSVLASSMFTASGVGGEGVRD